jgi:hypothetical protein
LPASFVVDLVDESVELFSVLDDSDGDLDSEFLDSELLDSEFLDSEFLDSEFLDSDFSEEDCPLRA